MRKRKRKLKKPFYFLRNILLLSIFAIFVYYFIKLVYFKNYIDKVEFDNDNVKIYLKEDNIECILSEFTPSIDDKWTMSDNKICSLKLNEKYSNIYLKKDDKIIKVKEAYFKINEYETVYLSNNQSYNFFKYILGDVSRIKVSIEDTSIVELNLNKLTIRPLKDGKTKVSIDYKDYHFDSNVIVTSLLGDRNDNKKSKLSCNKFNKNEEKLFDEILEQNIKNVGYKTRAGVVEAARFLSLDFPYRINYFYENGRQTTNKVDGEGRYYHKGLYLTDSKYDSLTGSSYADNKGPWGCSIYSYPIYKKDNNGLDCSGFVSWALLNGGFDVKDVGAGWSDSLDLTDYGDVKKIDSDLIKSNKIKVGDLLHSTRLGGHIGIIVGIDDENYYVAQAIWYDEVGLVVSKYKKEKLSSEFPHVVLMDKYYKKDGNLTNMW